MRSGKNSKIAYYARSYFHLLVPRLILKIRRKRLFRESEKRDDLQYIRDRVDYYCKDLTGFDRSSQKWQQESVLLCNERIRHPKVYYLDSLKYARYFAPSSRWKLCWGDVNYVPELPSVVKSRPIGPGNENSVIMKLDLVRHFIFLNDKTNWSDKKNQVIFRGAIGQMEGVAFKENRYRFMQMYFGNPMCDLGEVMEGGKYINESWAKPKISLMDHLEYKFIMALEGNDVASNLKWIMSSNSIAVMPRPRFETWFMEGKLIPDFHYIEIRDDFSDLEEKLNYYISNPEKAETIISNAHKYISQFTDSKRESIISLMVLDKYFRQTN